MIEVEKNISISRVTENDIDGIMQIEIESFNYPWKRETFEGELKNTYSRFFVAKVDNFPSGFIIYWDIPYEIHLINIAVKPAYRRMGIGTTLLREMIEYAKQNSKQLITLEVRVSNIAARLFYIKNGFIEAYIREKYYVDNDEDAIVMELSL
ncbi:MAG: ribosomal protein S18-alanine N-acetyltransferase [Myxococcota bacterium]